MLFKENSSKDQKSFEERRKYKRISQNFILSYFDKANPHHKFELTQLKNISMGGICFVATQSLRSQMQIGIELKTPYLSDTTLLDGVVLQSHEKIKKVLYEIRVRFEKLDPKAEFLLEKLIEYFVKLEGEDERVP